MGSPPEVPEQVLAGFGEQRAHGATAVVAGDVGMQVLPGALDAVGVGAIGRKEVQEDAPTELFERTLGQPGGMNAVVVDDQVDALGAGVGLGQRPQRIAEKSSVFSFAPVVWRTPVRTSKAPAK